MRVLPFLTKQLADRYGCDPEDVTMAATLDDLNLSDDDRSEIALLLGEVFGVEIPTGELLSFETVEDLVGYVEDREEV